MRVLVIDIDSLRPDHLGCYGYHRPTSPNIDALAAEGVTGTGCYCSDSPCMPSRHGFISGRFGHHHGVVSHGEHGARFRVAERKYGGPQPHEQVLPRVLRERGVHCAGFSTFPWRHCATWFGHAWSEFHTPSLGSGGERAEEIVDPFLDWLDRNRDRDDWFCYVNIWDPHTPYNQPQEWTDRMAEHPAPAWPDQAAIDGQQSITGSFTASKRKISNRDEYQAWIDRYDGAVAYADHHVGRIVDRLEQHGLWDDQTIVIVTADHGEAQGEHAIYGDHVCADECVHHIPLVVRAPSFGAGGRTLEDFVYQVDLSATLCQLFGAEVPEGWDGVGFLDRLRGEGEPARDHLVWGHGLYTLQRAVRTHDHLLIRSYDGERYDHFEEVQLYAIADDPHQTRNLATHRPEVVRELDHLLVAWSHQQAMRGGGGPDPLLELQGIRRRTPG